MRRRYGARGPHPESAVEDGRAGALDPHDVGGGLAVRRGQ
jgi:hypothetical protein